VPLPSDKLAIVYHTLAQLLGAGVTLAQALRSPSPAPGADCYRLAGLIESGASISEVIGAAGDWLPQSDRPFLLAAAGTGRLPLVLQNLAARHEQIGATRRRVIFASLYPVGVFHFAALIFPFLRMINFEQGIQGGMSSYVTGVLTILVPVWVGAGLLFYLVRRENPLAVRLLDLLPAIGGYRKNQALADFSFALGNLLEAGAPIGQAWRDSGRIARSRRILVASQKIEELIEGGLAPGPNLKKFRVFPADFVARYQTGETAGGLEKALLLVAADYQIRANQRLAAASMLYPSLLFGAVALMVAYVVIGFFMNYIGTLNKLMDGG
jgi:general secretion pathway protein F/type IV pilus assembly protein PilC